MMHEHGEASNCSFRTFWPTQPPEGGPPWWPGEGGRAGAPNRPRLPPTAANIPLINPGRTRPGQTPPEGPLAHIHVCWGCLKTGLAREVTRGGLQTDVPAAKGQGNHAQPTTMVIVNNCAKGGGWGDLLGTAQGTPVRPPYTRQPYESAAKSTARGKQILGSFASVRWPFRAAVAGPCSQPSPLLTCKIAGAAGVSILRIAVPPLKKGETDRQKSVWLLNSFNCPGGGGTV